MCESGAPRPGKQAGRQAQIRTEKPLTCPAAAAPPPPSAASPPAPAAADAWWVPPPRRLRPSTSFQQHHHPRGPSGHESISQTNNPEFDRPRTPPILFLRGTVDAWVGEAWLSVVDRSIDRFVDGIEEMHRYPLNANSFVLSACGPSPCGRIAAAVSRPRNEVLALVDSGLYD